MNIDDVLERVERLDEGAALSPPWHVDSLRLLLWYGHKEEGPWSDDCPDDMDLPGPEHAELIAAYRTDAPALAAEVRRLRAELNELHSTLWARIDETRERLRVEELKRAEAQQELATCKAAREELREEVRRLRARDKTCCVCGGRARNGCAGGGQDETRSQPQVRGTCRHPGHLLR